MDFLRGNDMSIEEFNHSGLPTIDNGGFLVSFQLKVRNEDNSLTWHYYGTPVPGDFLNGVPCVQHDAVVVQLADLSDHAYDTAREAAVAELSAG